MERIRSLARSLALLAGLACGASCGEGEPAPRPEDPAGSPRIPSFERDPDSMEGLPGGALTYVLPSPTERAAGAYLAPDDPLAKAFREEAARQRKVLTLRKRRLEETFATDAEALAIWEAALERPRVTRSRTRPDGTFDVVVQADLAPLFHHVTGR